MEKLNASDFINTFLKFAFRGKIMPTGMIEPPARWNSPPIRIGNIEGKTLYVQFSPEPTLQRPRGIWGFKIAVTGETLFNDSEAVVFEGPEASRIASDIATALIYIAEGRSPPLTNTPVRGYPEIRVEQLENRDVQIANHDSDISIPWVFVSSLGEKIENR